MLRSQAPSRRLANMYGGSSSSAASSSTSSSAATPWLVQSGTFFASKRSKGSAWPLDSGEGSRSYTETIDFETPFPADVSTTSLQICVFLSAVNIMKGADRRICASVERWSNTCFDLRISTWSDTRVWSCAVSWIAFDPRFANAVGGQIEIGRTLMSRKDSGYKLHKHNGDRNYKEKITFQRRNFATIPQVVVGLSAYDILDEADHRLAVSTQHVSPNGFKLAASTWRDTKVWSCEVTWIAFDASFLTGTRGWRFATGRWPFKKGPGFALAEGDGDRQVSTKISFFSPFASFSPSSSGSWTSSSYYSSSSSSSHASWPKAISFFSLIDVITELDHCVKTWPTNLSRSSFELCCGTWGEAHVWSCSPAYIVYAPDDAVTAAAATSGATSSSSSASSSASTSTPSSSSSSTVPLSSSSPTTSSTSSSSSGSGGGGSSSATTVVATKKQKTNSGASVATSSDNNEEEEEENVCKICMDEPISICFVPCGHLAVCESCSKVLTAAGAKKECPICRKKIKTCVKVFKA